MERICIVKWRTLLGLVETKRKYIETRRLNELGKLSVWIGLQLWSNVRCRKSFCWKIIDAIQSSVVSEWGKRESKFDVCQDQRNQVSAGLKCIAIHPRTTLVCRDRQSNQWQGGSESEMFNSLEIIARSGEPKTPILNCQISRALEPRNVDDGVGVRRMNDRLLIESMYFR